MKFVDEFFRAFSPAALSPPRANHPRFVLRVGDDSRNYRSDILPARVPDRPVRAWAHRPRLQFSTSRSVEMTPRGAMRNETLFARIYGGVFASVRASAHETSIISSRYFCHEGTR